MSPAGRRPHTFRPLVLCYHAISDGWEHPLAVSPAALERQVRSFLARGYRPAAWPECVGGRGRLLHVTFDDAYESVMRALPVLARLGVPCTVFACSGHADTGAPMGLPAADTAGVAAAELATMTWAQLREIAGAGVEIGSHTITHPHLDALPENECARELRASRARIEAELERSCRVLAYPFGAESAAVRAAARAAGYEAAFSMPGRVWSLDPYAVPRVGIIRRDGLLRATVKASRLASPVRALHAALAPA